MYNVNILLTSIQVLTERMYWHVFCLFLVSAAAVSEAPGIDIAALGRSVCVEGGLQRMDDLGGLTVVQQPQESQYAIWAPPPKPPANLTCMEKTCGRQFKRQCELQRHYNQTGHGPKPSQGPKKKLRRNVSYTKNVTFCLKWMLSLSAVYNVCKHITLPRVALARNSLVNGSKIVYQSSLRPEHPAEAKKGKTDRHRALILIWRLFYINAFYGAVNIYVCAHQPTG